MAERHGFLDRDTDDINNGHLEGFAIPQLNIDSKGRRADTYSSFLKPYENTRTNLVIVRHTKALRVMFDRNNTARGMFYTVEILKRAR